MNKKKIIIISSSLILVVLIVVLIFAFKKDAKKEDNNVVMFVIKDKTGKSYKNEIVVDANNTMEMEITISNKRDNDVYNYGLYYTYLSDERHGILIGQVGDNETLKVESSISREDIVLPIRITNISNEVKSIKLGLKYSKIDIKYEDNENKIDIYNSDVPNEPNLVKGMIPITYNEFKKVWEKADYSNWYDYGNRKWANAVMVTDSSRDNYINAKAGSEVKEEDILTYLVWIPRYRYKLFNTLFDKIDPIEINIVFEGKNSSKSNGTKNGEWLTHPAFTFGDQELAGIWVGKFETTGTGDMPTIKPNLVSLTNQNISTQFDTSRKINYVVDNEKDKIDAHIAKNVDWGAVVYLSHSKYGICTNGVCNNIRNNNVNTLNDINGPSVTGCSSVNPNGSMVVSDTCNTNYSRAYNDNEYGVLASTTYSIYGIYDMSGGSWETTMGVMKSEDGKSIISGRNETRNSGYTGILFDDNDKKIITKNYVGMSLPNSKYYDLYDFDTDIYSVNRSHYGDATGETIYWYEDFHEFVVNPVAWFMRGGLYNHNINDGVFAYGAQTGLVSPLRSFRTVIVNIK
ncbi:unknown [Clostridium sp. CAG:762]|nr:unknown [Clostridium sp. CAG:762]